MRAIKISTPLLFLALSCGSADKLGGAATGGQGTGGKGAVTGGTSATGGSSAGATSGGSIAAGGIATGGSPTATGGSSTATGGSSTATGGSSTATGGAASGALINCDLRQVSCRVATPACPSGQVPSVSGSCYGPCTAIAACACTTAAECPDNDQYTCWSRTHCGPYVD